MCRSIIIVIALGISALVQAQSDVEALRYSMQDVTGTARYVGVSGAFNALGADITTLSSNPGGLGVYRHSEVVGSMGVYANSYQSSYFDNPTTSGNTYFNIPNFGLVFSGDQTAKDGRKKVNGWVRTNFGIALNRISNYRSELRYEGINPHNSMMASFVEDLNSGGGTNPSDALSAYPFGAGQAYWTYMIDPMANDTTSYVSNIPYGGAMQSKDVQTKGRLNEWDFSLGGSYNDKLYLGATIGIPVLNYTKDATFAEEDVHDTIPYFDNYSYNEHLSVEASGVNLKVGLIYWITNNFRVGASIHTPTYLGFEEEYYTSMESQIYDTTYSYESSDNFFEYAVITPWRTMLSAALIGQYGFISAEYEYYNPGSARFWFNDGGDQSYEQELNNTINSKYGGVHTVKAGGELALDDFRLRGGLRFATTVFEEDRIPANEGDYQQWGYSLGAGYVGEWFFMDAAFQTTISDFADVPYTLQDPDATVGGALVDHNSYNIVLTGGVKF